MHLERKPHVSIKNESWLNYRALVAIPKVGIHPKGCHHTPPWPISVLDFHINGINYSYSQFPTYLRGLLEELKIDSYLALDRRSTRCSIAFTIVKRRKELPSWSESLHFIHHPYFSNKLFDHEMCFNNYFFIIRHSDMLLYIYFF